MIARKIVGPVGLLEKYRSILQQTETIRSLGNVLEITGRLVICSGPDVSLGELCNIERLENESYILAEVVGFKDQKVILSPLESISGVYPGCRVLSTGHGPRVALSPEILGRIVDGVARPLDGKGALFSEEIRSFENKPPNPIERPLIEEALPTGIRAIDSLLTVGRGQRVGIFSGSGVGKSTLLGMIGRFSKADVNVIALIGERGREVKEFIENELGEEGLKKSVIIVASSNESPMQRVRAAYLATTVAEYFRDMGKDVMLMMDSVTRLAMAQREVGLAAGEPATTKGYPPSVFSILPELLERAGTSPLGSITAFYTVLVEADDMNEPIADAVRGILDGHFVLSRKFAVRSHYPALDVAESISRSMPMVVSDEHLQRAARIREMISMYQENEDIINLGAYARGSNPAIDRAIRFMPQIQKFLRQDMNEHAAFEDSLTVMKTLDPKLEETRPGYRKN